ncbi:MAG TPA: hypothetical protein VFQ44_29825, partial [Streptosporangiaceae bacterium]|nr:hypothetical protein [Streptosporangiaceae bacterium]
GRGLRHFARARLCRWGTLLSLRQQQGAPPAPGQGPKFMIAGTFQGGLRVRYRHVIWARAKIQPSLTVTASRAFLLLFVAGQPDGLRFLTNQCAA